MNHSNPASTPDEDSRFEQVLADILRADERGEACDEAAWCARHPDLADELRSFFANRRAIGLVADRLREHALSTQGVERGAGDSRPGLPGDGPEGRTFGDYELEGELARGGMGVVYRARQRSLQRTVALKMVLAGRAASPAELTRFRQEAEAAARLEHPHIVPVYEVGEQSGRCYFTMKLIEGGNLLAHLDSLRADPRRAAVLVEQVARAVHFAHQRGVLHRDLKPANILIDEAGRPHVADFGLARLVDSHDRLTQTGAALGTPGYMAPEQIRGERTLTTAADVYSLGAILFVCLTGKPPFQSERAWETLQAALDSDPPSLRAANERVDRDLETICRKALEREPTRRYESPGALADDLSRWLKNEPIMARPPGWGRRVWKWARRHPARAVGVIASTVAVLVGGVQLSITWRALQGERQANERAESQLYRSLLALAEREWAVGEVENSREALRKCPESRRGWEWDYARRLCAVTPASLIVDRPQPIVGVAYSADGRRIGVVDQQGQVCVWDAYGREMALIKRDSRHRSACIALSFDGSQAAVVDADGLKVYEVKSGATIWSAAAAGRPLQLEYSPEGRYLALLAEHPPESGRSRQLRVWSDAGTLLTERLLPTSRERMGERFAFGLGDRLVVYPHSSSPESSSEPTSDPLILQVETGEPLPINPDERGATQRESPWPDAAPSAIGANGEWLVFAAPFGNPRLELRHVQTGRIVRVPVEGGRPEAYAFSRNGRLMAYAMLRLNLDADVIQFGAAARDVEQDSLRAAILRQSHVLSIHVVDLESGKQLGVLQGMPGSQVSLAFSPDGRKLVGAGGAEAASGQAFTEAMGIVLIWDVPARQTARTLQKNDAAIHDIAVIADGRYVVSGGEDKSLRAWDIASGRLLREWTDAAYAVAGLASSDDPNHVLGVVGKEIIEWNIDTGETRTLTSADAFAGVRHLLGAAMTRDGRKLAIAQMEAGSQLVQFTLPERRRAFAIPDRAQIPTYSRDGRLLAIPYHYDLHGELKVVDAGTGRVLQHWKSDLQGSLLRLGWGYLRAAFSPDNRLVAVVGNTGGADVYEIATGKRVHALRGHGTTVWDVAFSSTGTRLATAGYSDQTVKLWSLETGQEMHTLRGHEAAVTAVEFTPDDRRLISADRAGVIRIWETR
ncbi:MAG: protein kinase [Pirellulales bacterium]